MGCEILHLSITRRLYFRLSVCSLLFILFLSFLFFVFFFVFFFILLGAFFLVRMFSRQQYVDLYLDYYLNKSVSKQFEAFAQGFHRVCGGRVLVG